MLVDAFLGAVLVCGWGVESPRGTRVSSPWAGWSFYARVLLVVW
jgi:hypothetical protein